MDKKDESILKISKIYNLTVSDVRNILSDYKRGKSAYEIGKQHGITSSQVYSAVAKFQDETGQKLRKNKEGQNDYIEKIRNNNQKAIERIRNKYVLSSRDLINILKEYEEGSKKTRQLVEEYDLPDTQALYQIVKKMRDIRTSEENFEKSGEIFNEKMPEFILKEKYNLNSIQIAEVFNKPVITVEEDLERFEKIVPAIMDLKNKNYSGKQIEKLTKGKIKSEIADKIYEIRKSKEKDFER